MPGATRIGIGSWFTAIIVTDGAGDEVKMLAEGDVAPGTPLFKV